MMLKHSIFRAPAKINVTLRVLGRRSDGYHELDSWMHKIQLFDEISLEQLSAGGIVLSCPDSDLPEDSSNLVYQAAESFYRCLGETPAIKIILKKSIPVSAGLGGGSSDCAAVLNGLNELFDKPLSKQILLQEGGKIGADVPFFIEDFLSARARGIGERLTPLPLLPLCHILLVNPGIAVSTGWVFAQLAGKIPVLDHSSGESQKSSENNNYALTREYKTYNLGRASAKGKQLDLFNDLEQITLAHFPEIALIKKTLLKYNAEKALMCGSGSTVFGLFTNKKHVVACMDRIQVEHPDWKLFLTEPFLT
jgi:4-diphosphocytidyl-2-C-methyl-D-erythritol kinase